MASHKILWNNRMKKGSKPMDEEHELYYEVLEQELIEKKEIIERTAEKLNNIIRRRMK